MDKDGADIDLRITGAEVGSGIYRTQDGSAVLVGGSGEYWMWTENDIASNEEGFSNEVYETLRSYGDDREEFATVLRAFGVKPIIRL